MAHVIIDGYTDNCRNYLKNTQYGASNLIVNQNETTGVPESLVTDGQIAVDESGKKVSTGWNIEGDTYTIEQIISGELEDLVAGVGQGTFTQREEHRVLTHDTEAEISILNSTDPLSGGIYMKYQLDGNALATVGTDGIATGVTYEPSPFGQQAVFDGSANIVLGSQTATIFTASCFVTPSVIDATTKEIFRWSVGDGNNLSNGNFGLGVSNLCVKGSLAYHSFNYTLPLGVRTHVLTTWNYATEVVKLYIDGVYEEEVNVGSITTEGGNVQLGRTFIGSIDQFELYYNQLTSDNVTALYTQTITGQEDLLYIDSVLQPETPSLPTGTLESTNTASIGYADTIDTHIAPSRAWSTVKTQAEILANHNEYLLDTKVVLTDENGEYLTDDNGVYLYIEYDEVWANSNKDIWVDENDEMWTT